MMAHAPRGRGTSTVASVNHMGFHLEQKATQIVAALAWVPENQRDVIIEALSPTGLRERVREMFGA